jgi:hypothetical protein
MKQIDKSHPMAICNGITILGYYKKDCKDIDILGTNVYRGVSFGDAFKKKKRGAKQTYNVYRVWC